MDGFECLICHEWNCNKKECEDRIYNRSCIVSPPPSQFCSEISHDLRDIWRPSPIDFQKACEKCDRYDHSQDHCPTLIQGSSTFFRKEDTHTAKLINLSSSTSNQQKPQYVPKNEQRSKATSKCKKCGTSHKSPDCPASNSYCSHCKKNGHFEEVCLFKDKRIEPSFKYRPGDVRNVPIKETENIQPINDTISSTNELSYKKICQKCGTSHINASCPAKNTYCDKCDHKGHLSECCKIEREREKKEKEIELEQLNDLCRYIYSTESETYGTNVKGNTLKERIEKATKIRKEQIDTVIIRQEKASNLELCFLIDGTDSMQQYIVAVKKCINSIVKKIRNVWGFKIRLALVIYRDFDIKPNVQSFDFTDSIEMFRNYACAIGGGDDIAEDVFSGLKEALNLRWSDGTKIIYHIADAPCHGRKYHNLSYLFPQNTSRNDHYLDKPHPAGLTAEKLFAKLREKKIEYYFGKITNLTDIMINEFSKVYGKMIVTHDIKKTDNILEAVLSAVSATVTTKFTEARQALSLSENSERNLKIIKEEPDWNKVQEKKVTSLTYEMMKSINEIVELEFSCPKPLEDKKIKVAPNPFDKGGDRLTYYGKIITKNKITDAVFKEYISTKNKDNISINYRIPNEISTISSFFAQAFNDKLNDQTMKISFLKVYTIKIPEEPETKNKARYLCAEKRLTEQYHKFSNNGLYYMSSEDGQSNGISESMIEKLSAFSHFTYKESNGCLIIVDLQGVINEDGSREFVLTDPSIHCKNYIRFGKTNFGEIGMTNFFKSHRCNLYCKKLDLTEIKIYK